MHLQGLWITYAWFDCLKRLFPTYALGIYTISTILLSQPDWIWTWAIELIVTGAVNCILTEYRQLSLSIRWIMIFPKQVESVIEFEPGLKNFTEQLMEMKDAQARVYLMYATWVIFSTLTHCQLPPTPRVNCLTKSIPAVEGIENLC